MKPTQCVTVSCRLLGTDGHGVTGVGNGIEVQGGLGVGVLNDSTIKGLTKESICIEIQLLLTICFVIKDHIYLAFIKYEIIQDKQH